MHYMRPFLNKLYIYIFVFVVVSVFADNIKAISKFSYYKEVFESFGIDIRALKQSNITLQRPLLDIVPEAKDSNAYPLILSSELGQESLLKYLGEEETILLICDTDTPYSLQDFFVCNRENLVLDKNLDSRNYSINLDNSGLVSVYESRILIIPEHLLYVPSSRSLLKAYLASFADSTKYNNFGEDVDPFDQTLFSVAVGIVRESALYILLGFLVLTVSGGIIKKIFVDEKINITNWQMHTLEDFIRPVYGFFNRMKWFSLYLLLILLVFYIPVLTFISFRDTGSLDLNYISSYFISVLNFNNLIVWFRSENVIRIILFFYNIALVILTFFVLLPEIIEMTARAFRNTLASKVKPAVARKALIFLILFCTVLSLFFDPKFSGLLLFASFLLICYFESFSSYWVKSSYTKREIGLITLFISFAFLSYLLFGYAKKELFKNSKYVPLIKADSKYLVLPYQVTRKKDTLFSDSIVNSNYSIIVDDYMIYQSQFSKISNRPVKNFSDEGDYILIFSSKKDYVSFILKHSNYKDLFASNVPTNFFYFEKENSIFDSKFYLNFSFHCVVDTTDSNIVMNLNFLYSDSTFGNQSIRVLHFPGCSAGETVSYKVPAKLIFPSNALVIVEMTDLNSSLIDKLVLTTDTKEIPIHYIKNFSGDRLILPNIKGTGDTLYFYSTDTLEPYDVDNTGSSINLAKYANDLLSKGLIKDTFTIWSLNKAAQLNINNVE